MAMAVNLAGGVAAAEVDTEALTVGTVLQGEKPGSNRGRCLQGEHSRWRQETQSRSRPSL